MTETKSLREYVATTALGGLLANAEFCERLKCEVAVLAAKKNLTDAADVQMEITADIATRYADKLIERLSR